MEDKRGRKVLDDLKGAFDYFEEQKKILQETLLEVQIREETFQQEMKQREVAFKSEMKEYEKKLKQREDSIRSREERLSLCRSDIQDPIVLDVGGKIFKSTKVTLMKAGEGSIFQDLFSDASVAASKEPIFIDRDGKLFIEVLNYLRTGELVGVTDETLRTKLLKEAIFYGIEGLIELLDSSYADMKRRKAMENSWNGGTLLDSDQKVQLSEWTGSEYTTWKLIHKSSLHGFGAKKFHKNCDKKGPTVAVVKSMDGYIFGGYTKDNWDRDGYGDPIFDPSNFLFTLTNPNGIPPTKYVNYKGFSIYNSSNFGPTFGGGAGDLIIADNADKSESGSNFPEDYDDSTSLGSSTFTGSPAFLVEDMEVYCRV